MDERDLQHAMAQMRAAREKSRGYADYWEWPLDRSQEEVGVVAELAEFITEHEGTTWEKIKPVEDDPPDAELIEKCGKKIGVEVTELVDPALVESHRYAKKHGLRFQEWAEWDIEKLSAFLIKIIEKKDKKLERSREKYELLFLAIATDEPMIDIELAESVSKKLEAKALNIDRVFLLLSYEPQSDRRRFSKGLPVFSLKLD